MDSDLIGITGSLVTILGIGVTIHFARQANKHKIEAKKYSDQIKSDLRKINLSNCTDMLKKMLEEIRRLPIDIDQIPKGVKVENLILNIKSYFDGTLSLIDITNNDRDLRVKVSHAQKILHQYEREYLARKSDLTVSQNLQVEVQDCISIINTKIFSSEA